MAGQSADRSYWRPVAVRTRRHLRRGTRGRDWGPAIIIATSIPLAILGSIATLSALGETLNIMTLGGLALAVGILVDDATVTIENINWHLAHGKEVETAILDGAAQIVTPAFVSLLCICIVFVPMFFLNGVARFLFVPM